MTTVLVVDDEFGIGEVIEALLVDEGYDVVLAVNGHQALKRLEARPVDLVLTDFMMPLLDGPGLIRALKADARYDRLPIVVMSSLPEAQVASRIGGQYQNFLRKPFRAEAVLAVIREALVPLDRS